MNKKLNFMDFCTGIGGGRLGLTNSNLNCVAFSEIDNSAEKHIVFYMVIMKQILEI